MSVLIEYGNYAPGAKTSFEPEIEDITDFSQPELLKQYGTTYPNYANPCELYSVPLDSSAVDLDIEGTFGIWSNAISGEDGAFDEPIILTLVSSKAFSAPGITLAFDEYNNIFANDIEIDWYLSNTVVSRETFTPDTAKYFCENQVSGFDKIVITFNSLNMPYNRLKLRGIDYGEGVILTGDELKSVNVIQEINPISAEISINTTDFTLEAEGDLAFQKRQSLLTYFNDKLISCTFVSSAKRTSKTQYTVQSEDYIGILDDTPYAGGMYSDELAATIIADIFNKASVPYEIDSSLNAKTVSGWIPYGTCRDALMQVCFAIGAVVDTSYSSVVKVFALSDTVTQRIPLDRIAENQSVETDTRVTAVELTAHTFTPLLEDEDVVEVYNAGQSGTGNNIKIIFNEPLHYFAYDGDSDILEINCNYAVFNARSEFSFLSGHKYRHDTVVKRADYPGVLEGDPENVKSITEATLISPANIDEILAICYNEFGKNTKVVAGIYEGYSEGENGEEIEDMPTKVSEKIAVATDYLGDIEGFITRQSYNLNGGIILKQSEVK